ncbi:transposase-like protein [Cupriavidus alkaliphilus]|nr:transposase-like protein [Cupriavidus alkaliphilus]
MVNNKAVYLPLGIEADVQSDVLAPVGEQTEGANFWLKVFNDLISRSCKNVRIAVVDGLKGWAKAVATAYSSMTVQNLHRAFDPQQPGLRELQGR